MSTRLQILFAILGIILTAAGVFASLKQYEAASIQAKAATIQLEPKFQIRTLLSQNENGQYSDERMEITNVGGPALNFEANRITWIELKSPTLNNSQVLDGYYSAIFSTGLLSGELESIVGDRNNLRFIAFDKIAREVCECNVSRPKTLIRLSYIDVMEVRHTGYFLVEGNAARLLEINDGEKRWTAASALNMTASVNLDRLETREQIVKWFNSMNQKSNAPAKG